MAFLLCNPFTLNSSSKQIVFVLHFVSLSNNKVCNTSSNDLLLFTIYAMRIHFRFFQNWCQLFLFVKIIWKTVPKADSDILHLFFSLYLTHMESKIPRQLCMRVNNYVCKEVMKFLDEDGFNCKLDIGKLDDMMVAVKSILASKPTCQLSLQEIDHLSIIILKVFMNWMSLCLITKMPYSFSK